MLVVACFGVFVSKIKAIWRCLFAYCSTGMDFGHGILVYSLLAVNS